MADQNMADPNNAGSSPPLRVYYDGACPGCVRDRQRYERLAGGDSGVEWFDITGEEAALRDEGIDPERALFELHVRDSQGRIHAELDAYILLMQRVDVLKPLAWLIGLPLLRPVLSRAYRAWVRRRLQREGRLPGGSCRKDNSKGST